MSFKRGYGLLPVVSPGPVTSHPQVCGDVTMPRMYLIVDKLDRKCADFFLRSLRGINELAIVQNLF